MTSTAGANDREHANVWDHHIVDFSNPGAIDSSSLHPQSVPSTSSPSSGSNWYVIRPSERVTDYTWRKVIAASSSAATEGENEDKQLSAVEILALCR